MSDIRFDPVTGNWVAIARNRLERPTEFIPLEQVRQQLICPFCRGNEEETPETLAAYHVDGEPLSEDDEPSSWTVRVVPNKYPSFSATNNVGFDNGPYDANNGLGSQEIIIPSNRHVASLSELTEEEMHVTFTACQHRLAIMKADESIRHGMLFMNCRSAAGASLGHVHLQLIGSPLISQHLQGRLSRNLESVQKHGQSLIRRVMSWEQEKKIRMIKQTDNFCVFCPFASRFAFQVWIVPADPQGGFIECPPAKRNELAHLCRSIVEHLENLLDHPAYNLLLHMAPFEASDYDHWYFELFPRLTCAAGFEWGTDIWVNPVSPEAAARRMQ